MAKYPQYTADMFYAGEADDFGGIQPNNTAEPDDWPEIVPGYWPRKLAGARGWEQVENHEGEQGYVNDQVFTIAEYGPYPDGWSDTPPEPTEEEKSDQVRARRDGLMAATDYLMMPDYPLDAETKAAVMEYRQALRDLPQHPGFPNAVIWPEIPKGNLKGRIWSSLARLRQAKPQITST